MSHDYDFRVCDFCGATEIDDILSGAATDMIAITVRSDGRWMCAECKSALARDTEPEIASKDLDTSHARPGDDGK